MKLTLYDILGLLYTAYMLAGLIVIVSFVPELWAIYPAIYF
ncbi:MAG: hypothetical protein O3B41_05530 [Bacteroidetes bacterium]|nr:hypothetical protein [Bacteroidota bacterium]